MTIQKKTRFSTAEISFRGAGSLIRELREKIGLSQKEAAEQASMAPEVLNRIENDKLGLSTSALARLAAVLNKEPLQLAKLCLERVKFPK